MTSDDEVFDYIGLNRAQRNAYILMAEASGRTVRSLMAEPHHLLLQPLISSKFLELATASLARQKAEPVTVRYVQGQKQTNNGTRLCSLEGCTIKHEQHGLCSKHFQQQLRDYVPIPPLSINDLGQWIDSAGFKICDVCKNRRSVAKDMCASCRYTASRST